LQDDKLRYSKNCLETFEVKKASQPSRRSISAVMKDYKSNESNLDQEERERLLEKVRKINLKFSKNLKSQESNGEGS